MWKQNTHFHLLLHQPSSEIMIMDWPKYQAEVITRNQSKVGKIKRKCNVSLSITIRENSSELYFIMIINNTHANWGSVTLLMSHDYSNTLELENKSKWPKTNITEFASALHPPQNFHMQQEQTIKEKGKNKWDFSHCCVCHETINILVKNLRHGQRSCSNMCKSERENILALLSDGRQDYGWVCLQNGELWVDISGRVTNRADNFGDISMAQWAFSWESFISCISYSNLQFISLSHIL